MGISPLLFNLMSILLQIVENAKPCKKTQYLLNIFQRKLLVSNTCCVFRKSSMIYTIGVY